MVNWSELRRVADDGGFQVLPHGEYDVHVVSAAAGKTSTGKDRIRVTFKVENGPHNGAPVVNDFNITADNATAMSIFFRHMAVLGLDGGYFATNPGAPIEKVAADLQEKRTRCRLRLSSRTWQGQERNNVDAILPPMPGTAASASPSPVPHQSPAAHHSTPPASGPPVPSAPASQPLPVPAAPVLPDDLPF